MKYLTAYSKKFSFTLALFCLGCGGSGNDPSPSDNEMDRKIILTHWVDNIVKPSYTNFKVKLDAMTTKVNAFTALPDQTSLTELRAAWVDAYTEWQKVELFEFGAADRYTLRNFYNIYPASVDGIAANIQNPLASLELPASYPTQGFPGLDYLLNGIGVDDNAILALYTSDSDAAKRIDYLKRLVTRMNTLLTTVMIEWEGTYREAFINKTGLDIGSSMGQVVNAYVLHYERFIRSGKFGIPSGVLTTVPVPQKVEAYYKKDLSLQLAQSAHEAAVNFFNGINVTTGLEGPSFKSYLDALNAKDAVSGKLLSEIINEQFEVVNGNMSVLTSNLYDQIQTDNQKMIDVYTNMQAAVRMIKVDMTSAMSITITYTDNDGD